MPGEHNEEIGSSTMFTNQTLSYYQPSRSLVEASEQPYAAELLLAVDAGREGDVV